MKALIHGDLFDFEILRKDYYVLFDTQILEVGPMSRFPGAEEVYDCKGCILMPGLVLGHTHMYSTFARGWNIPFSPNNFRELLEQLWWKLDGALDREAVYYSGLVSAVEYIRNGVTTVIDHHASGRSIRGTLRDLKKALCEEMGLRGIFCFETSDRFPIGDCITENREFAKEKSRQCAGLFGMHASMTLSNHTLQKIAEESGELPIHIHAAESIEDQQYSRMRYQKTVIERLEQYGLLRSNSILAHCIHLDEKEIETMAKHDIRVALNPTSNMNNGVGLPDYIQLKKKGIRCILGNDGLGYNITREMLNFVYGMHHAYQSPLGVSLQDLKEIIQNTYRYAESILGCALGKIEKGYEADLICVPYTPPTEWHESNVWGHFFYGILDGFHPRDVWCGGWHRLKNYEVQADTEKIYGEARKVSKRIWDTIGGGEHEFTYKYCRNWTE